MNGQNLPPVSEWKYRFKIIYIIASFFNLLKADIPDVATLSSPKDLERVREQTLHITNLFHKLKTRLPVALYHHNIVKAHCWLYYYKCFLEHLQALALNGYKYNMEELSDFEAQVRKELNLMRDTIIVKCQRAQGYPSVNLDAIAELNIDWSIV
jgi:hypothetical protein